MKRIIIFSLLALMATGLHAQSLLTVPNDARTMSMADATFATSDNAFGAIANPASFVLGKKNFSVGLNYTYFQPGKIYGQTHIPNLAAAYRINDRWSVSLNAGSFLMKGYESWNKDTDLSIGACPHEIFVSAGVGFRIIDQFSVGANIRYFNSSLANETIIPGYRCGNAVSADIALMYAVRGIGIAAGVSDIGSKVKYGESAVAPHRMPMSTKLGISYDLFLGKHNELTFTVQSNWYPYVSSFAFSASVEYTLNDYLFVRGGYRYADGKQIMPSYGSAGIGGKVAGVSLAGAYLIAPSNSPLHNTFSLNLSYEF